MKPLVWRVWVQATMPSKCLRTIRATSFIGSTLEPVSKGTQTPAQARETARSGGRLHGFLPGRGDHRDGRSTLSKRALRAQDIGAPLPEHGGDDVDLLAVEDIAKMLTIEPGARRALCGGLGDQAVEIGATFVREAIAVLEQRPAQPFEAWVGALFEPSHLVDGGGRMGHDVEFVEGDASIGQMLAHAFDEGRR